MQRPRAAISGVFLLVGIMLGTWFARLPQVRTELRLGYGELGVVLVAQAIGVIIATQVAGHLAGRFGTRPVIRLTAAVVPWFLPLVAATRGTIAASAAMLAWGLVAGLLDVGMNAQGVEVERTARRPVLSSLHAAWGAGALLGSLLTVAAVRAGWSIETHFCVVAIGLTVAALASGRNLLAEPALPGQAGRRGPGRGLRAGWTRAIVVLGMLGAAAAVCEGAVSGWCGIFLHEQRGAAASVASLAYTAFVVAETGTRTVGDRLHHRFGAVALVRYAMAVTILGVVLAVTVPNPWFALGGFAIQGCGIAVLVPVISGAAGHAGSPSATSLAIARFSTLYYGGVVAGPAVIGWMAQAFGVGTALALLALPLAVIGVLAGSTAPASIGRRASGPAPPHDAVPGHVPGQAGRRAA